MSFKPKAAYTPSCWRRRTECQVRAIRMNFAMLWRIQNGNSATEFVYRHREPFYRQLSRL